MFQPGSGFEDMRLLELSKRTYRSERTANTDFLRQRRSVDAIRYGVSRSRNAAYATTNITDATHGDIGNIIAT